jgi:hypothetical protein
MNVKDVEDLIERLGPAGSGDITESTEIVAYFKSEMIEVEMVYSNDAHMLCVIEK